MSGRSTLPLRLTKNDSADIGLALACIGSRAIHLREFKEWLYHVIEHVDEPPAYIFDLLDVEQLIDLRPVRILGWLPSTSLSDDELELLEGISRDRGISDPDPAVARGPALTNRREDEPLYRRVKDLFPFLDLESVVGPDPDKGW